LADDGNRLAKALSRLVRQARTSRRVRWSGRVLLISAIALLLMFVLRTVLRGKLDLEILPVDPLLLLAFAVSFVLVAMGALELALWLTGPTPLRIARYVDRRHRLRDLVTAGLTAARMEGPIPREVASRAANALGSISPAALYPVQFSIAKLVAVLPLLLVSFYLLGLPPGGGPIPLLAEGATYPGGETPSAVPDEPDEPAAEPEIDPEDEPEPEVEPEPEKEPEVPDQVRVKIIPARKRYKADQPILLFVLANPGEHMEKPHDLSVSLALNGEIYETTHRVKLDPGEGGKAVVSIDGRTVEKMAEKLQPGKHRVAALITGEGIAAVSEEAEFEIEGDPGGGGSAPPPPPEEPPPPPPEPEPKPEPEGEGQPPPPPMEVQDRLVDPLFGEGDVVRKKGIALVPDPNAPAGAPPRRLTMPEAAAEAGRRGSTGVPTERVLAKDRELVTRYFELLKDADAKKKE